MITRLKEFFKSNKTTAITILLWFSATLLWFALYGFNYNLEGEKYSLQADYFLQHFKFEEKRHFFYLTTILIIAFCKTLYLKKAIAILILLAFNLLAYIKLSKALELFFKHKQYALGAVGFLVFFPPFQSWTMYLYTENIFYSLVLILLAQVLTTTYLSIKNISIFLTLIILLIFSRPLGILFIAPLLLFLFLIATKKQQYLLLIFSIVGAIAFYYVSQIVFTTTPDWTVQRSFNEENLICDIPTATINPNLKLISDKSQLKVLLYYITHNFGHFWPLALKRLQLFFLNTRTYYSSFHNVYLLAVLLTIYGVLAIRCKSIWKNIPKPLFWFITSLMVLFAGTIALQCDDYHNRFFMTLMPFWVLLVTIGLHSFFYDKLHKN
jgi:hypothetical protein